MLLVLSVFAYSECESSSDTYRVKSKTDLEGARDVVASEQVEATQLTAIRGHRHDIKHILQHSPTLENHLRRGCERKTCVKHHLLSSAPDGTKHHCILMLEHVQRCCL